MGTRGNRRRDNGKGRTRLESRGPWSPRDERRSPPRSDAGRLSEAWNWCNRSSHRDARRSPPSRDARLSLFSHFSCFPFSCLHLHFFVLLFALSSITFCFRIFFLNNPVFKNHGRRFNPPKKSFDGNGKESVK